LGANLTSLSHPILQAAVRGAKETVSVLSLLIEELRNSMFLLGADSVQALRKVPIVITSETAEWLRMRGFNVESYARRERS
jgi:isopentenyl-diphosphate delta-isomerase